MSSINLDMFLDAVDKALRPVLYYGTTEYVKRGELFLCAETETSPEFIVCHPDDLEELATKLILTRRLVNIKDQPLPEYIARLQQIARKRLEEYTP